MSELTQDQITALAELRSLQEQVNKANVLIEERKEELRKIGLGRHTVKGEDALDITGGAAFDAVTAREVLTSGEYLVILVPKPDAKLAEQKLSGEKYARCQKPKALSVKPL